MEERIEILIAKYFVNQITDAEITELKQWLSKGDNKAIYKEYIDANYAVESSKQKTYSEADYNKLKQLLEEQQKQNRTLKSILKYAAVFTGLLIASYTYYSTTKSDIVADAASVVKNEEVTLVMGNGVEKKIDTENEAKLLNAQGSVLGMQVGSELVYNKKQKEVATKTAVQNTLKVPYGKFFKVTLNDGTQVHLNAGSSLTYPEVFAENAPRKVNLVGEGYFVVSKDKKRPFIVNANNMDVKVLGTQFDFSAYPNGENYVVLVEGSLAVKKTQTSEKDLVKSMLVKPNQKAYLNEKSGKVELTTVSVGKYISWKTGELYFENEPFSTILTRLQRHYNVTIKNNNAELNNIRFTGRFNKENVLEVLNTFKLHTSFNYSLEDKTIIIK